MNRDKQKCQNCGKPKGVLEKRPEVIIIEEKENKFDLTNVVSVCRSCEEKLNTKEELIELKESEVSIETNLYICPHKDCSEDSPSSWFETERAMKIHYGSKHSDSISKIQRECKDCSSNFKKYKYRNRVRCRDCTSD